MLFCRCPQTPLPDPFLSLSLRVRGGLAVTTAPSLVAVGCPITSGTHALGSNQDMPNDGTTLRRGQSQSHEKTLHLTQSLSLSRTDDGEDAIGKSLRSEGRRFYVMTNGRNILASRAGSFSKPPIGTKTFAQMAELQNLRWTNRRSSCSITW